MVEKFEVGKMYHHPKSQNQFTVIGVGNYKVLIQFENGIEGTALQADAKWYDEYHEPKVEKFTKFVSRYCDEAPVTSCRNLEGYALLGKIEITLTDGKITSVEIVKE